MAFIKFLLVLALCAPIIYLSMFFVDRLVNDLQDQNIYKERVKRPARKRPSYNFKYEGRIDSKRDMGKRKNGKQQIPKKKERF